MAWSQETISLVWEKGRRVYGENPRRFRKDACGAWIAGAHFGNRQSEFGWTIARLDVQGDDDPANLIPLQWQNGVDADGSLVANVVAERSHNVTRTLSPLVA
ncbi:MAG TPA: hypothetical protein VMF70_11685 [Gemmatimonadales bacterium]|nr:hypothetical protein [Gemmatimonadales bacterium]